jgi:hypothetical protein
MKQPFLILITLFLIASVSGITASEIPEDPSDQQIDNFVEVYNNNTEEVPGFVGSVVGGQDINLDYENNSYGIKMNSLRIDEVREPFEQPSLNVWVEKEDVVDVANATSPRQELRQKLDNGEIKYEEKGIVNKLKFSVFRLFL